MATSAGEPQPCDRRAILRGGLERTQPEQLIDGDLAVMPVAAGDAKFALEVYGRQQFRVQNLRAQARGVAREHIERRGEETWAARVPTAREIAGRVLHDCGEHLLARRREARVMQRGHGDLEHRSRRELAILGRIERGLDVAEAV